jgi:hypothetical protein
MANLKYIDKDTNTWISLGSIRGPKGDNADITINGTTTQNASFYAPTTSGEDGQILVSKGDGLAPEWTPQHVVPVVGNGTLTIQKNASTLGSFSANSSSNQTINIETPTNQNIVDLIYPIGSIYLTLNQTNPTILFGGEWEQIKDKFLIGAGDSHNLGNNYGSNTKNLSHTHAVQNHTLTIAEIPSHTHTTGIQGDKAFDASIANNGNTANVLFNQSSGVATTSTGGGGAHNHGNTSSQLSSTFDITPASVAVYIWKRIG